MARLAPTEQAANSIAARIPLSRDGEITDVAESAVFLVSETARYVTGTILDCDSGSQPGDARDRQSAHNTTCRLKYEVKPTAYG